MSNKRHIDVVAARPNRMTRQRSLQMHNRAYVLQPQSHAKHKTQFFCSELQRSDLHRCCVDKCVLFIFAQEIETQIMMIFVRCLSRRRKYMRRRKHGKSSEAQTARKLCELWQKKNNKHSFDDTTRCRCALRTNVRRAALN